MGMTIFKFFILVGKLLEILELYPMLVLNEDCSACRPHSTESFTHRKMTLSLADRSTKKQKVKVLPISGRDPESQRSEMIKVGLILCELSGTVKSLYNATFFYL